MSKMEASELFSQGMESMKNGDTKGALEHLENAVSLERNPLYCSHLAICLAKEKRDFKKAVSLCNEAIKKDPRNSQHFLNLGRVYLIADLKKDALRILNMGLRFGENREIIAELRKFERRRPPALSFLPRENPINKFLGKITYKLGLR
ncbi:MAG TPA: hypothetical protein VF799_02140 [Geobacteraceae bacterium]